jgi:hypothetical protein
MPTTEPTICIPCLPAVQIDDHVRLPQKPAGSEGDQSDGIPAHLLQSRHTPRKNAAAAWWIIRAEMARHEQTPAARTRLAARVLTKLCAG